MAADHLRCNCVAEAGDSDGFRTTVPTASPAIEPCRRARRRRTQVGETLVESLLAILILSVVVVAYAGLQTAITASVQHHESAVAETLLRTAAERLQDPATPYVPRADCPGAPTYAALPTREGWGPVTATVRFWQPPAGTGDGATPLPVTFAPSGGTGDCPVVDPGLQSIELRALTPSGRVEQLQIVKREN